MKEKNYDVCILGGGPAGLSAGIYSARYGLDTVLVSRDIGGTANLAHELENYPGFNGSGLELMKKFSQQAKKAGAKFVNAVIVNLEKDKTGFEIKLANGEFIYSKTLIIALGTEKRKLNVNGEEKFLGRGISYCTTCDAPLFKNKVVSVIGGRNSAAKAALLLARYAKKVYIIYRQAQLNCDDIEKKKLENRKNIEIIYNSVPVEVKGEDVVESIEIEQKGKKKELKVEGVFIEIGAIPVTSIIGNLKINVEKGYIIVDEEMRTNIKGVFAAGDITKGKLKQIIVAAAQGALAAKSAKDYLDER